MKFEIIATCHTGSQCQATKNRNIIVINLTYVKPYLFCYSPSSKALLFNCIVQNYISAFQKFFQSL